MKKFFNGLDGQTLHSLLLLVYCLGSQLSFDMPQFKHFHFLRSFDMHKAIVEIYSFLEVIQVIRGCQRSLEGQTLDLLLLLYSWGSKLSFDMHKAIVKTFSFLEVISVIRGRKRSLEGQTLYVLLLLYSLGSQLLFDMHKAIVKTFSFLEVIQVITGCQRS